MRSSSRRRRRRGCATPDGLETEVKRMLADSALGALSTRFAGSVAAAAGLREMHPDACVIRIDDTLAQAMHAKPKLFFDSIVRRTIDEVLDLITADYTFVNERSAEHYGSRTSPAARSSAVACCRRAARPARRGQRPGADVGRRSHLARAARQVGDGSAARDAAAAAAAGRAAARRDEGRGRGPARSSVRERMEEHRKNPVVRVVPHVIDPLGLALENFDPTGAWRIKDNGVRGRPARRDVRRHAARRSGRACGRRCSNTRTCSCGTSRSSSMMYALGRRVEYDDMPTVRAIVATPAHTTTASSSFIVRRRPDSQPRFRRARRRRHGTTNRRHDRASRVRGDRMRPWASDDRDRHG